MCVEGGFFFKISKRDFTFIREMRVNSYQHFIKNILELLKEGAPYHFIC